MRPGDHLSYRPVVLPVNRIMASSGRSPGVELRFGRWRQPGGTDKVPPEAVTDVHRERPPPWQEPGPVVRAHCVNQHHLAPRLWLDALPVMGSAGSSGIDDEICTMTEQMIDESSCCLA